MATVAIRVDGGGQFGHGHLYRCLALGQELRDRGIGVLYYTRTQDILLPLSKDGPTALREYGSDAQWIAELALQHSALVVDLPEVAGLPRPKGMVVLPRSHPWPGHTVQVDWSHVVLRREFALHTRTAPLPGKVFVSAGGTDPGGLMPLLLEATAGMDVRQAPGPRGPIAAMAAYMATCEVALVSFGVTALELAACGVPAIYVCLTEHHAEGARACEEAGFGISLGLCRDPKLMREHLGGLLQHPEVLARMRAAASVVDGKGAERVAKKLQRWIEAGICDACS